MPGAPAGFLFTDEVEITGVTAEEALSVLEITGMALFLAKKNNNE